MTVWIADVGVSSGVNGYYQTEKLANSITSNIVSDIRNMYPYTVLSDLITPNIANSYFTAEIKTIIWPLIRDYIIGFHNPNTVTPQTVLVDNSVIYSLIEPHWPKTGPKLHLNTNTIWFRRIKFSSKQFAKRLIDLVPPVGINIPHRNENRLGVECCNTELQRNSILRWISSLPHNRIILCPFQRSPTITARTLSNLNLKDVSIIDLVKGASQGLHDHWRTGLGKKHTLHSYRINRTVPIRETKEKWINQYAETLLRTVDFWRGLFNKNKIRIYIHYNPQHLEGIAKQIALDMEGGILLFVQRSNMISVGGSVARRASHICFCWGNPAYAVGAQNDNNIDYYVISGVSDEENTLHAKHRGKSYRCKVSEAGSKFVVTIFDNASSSNIMYGETVLNDFYEYLLRWVLDNPEHGLIIKPKKNSALELTKFHKGSQHPQDRISIAIHDLLMAAVATGRCLVLDESEAPESAAYAADISVGLGHSTAACRSAIENLRSIHCDLSRNPDEPLAYDHLGTLMFHDLDTVINTLNIHKQYVMSGNTKASPIGDNAAIIEDLDPFQDGKANIRISEYISYLLEGYDSGYEKGQAIALANKKFISRWGEDKVMSGTITIGQPDHG